MTDFFFLLIIASAVLGIFFGLIHRSVAAGVFFATFWGFFMGIFFLLTNAYWFPLW